MGGTEAVMTAVFVVVAVAGFTLFVAREGFRQGDQSQDPISEVSIGRLLEGGVVVRAELDNRSTSPVVVTCSMRWISRLRPISGVGRVTRRRIRRPADGHLIAVDGGDTVGCEWNPASTERSRRLVVDLFVWQRAGRIRRHRRVFLLEPTVGPLAGRPGVEALWEAQSVTRRSDDA